ncbi:hypothetical protein ATPR_3150 [Acetobacter tropicalis NBRC 101654]|uniref:Uncharacterized protein n=1 Tax=Acetobacter tropicalis NBRC 101654 TaxID=749388 RepID=F7VIF1_9PROT|nr:hypothetical protein ATPR_3150 [Acetobacter tropicalis NBRC 101654]
MVAFFDFRQPVALVVQHIQRNLSGYMHRNGGRTAACPFFFHSAQHMQGRAFNATHHAGALTVRAGRERSFRHGRAQPLARHFQQPEMGDGAHLDAGAIMAQRVFQAALNHGVVAARLHINEVDHNQASQITQAELARDFISRFLIGAEGCFFNVALACGLAGVHVNRNKGFCLVDDQIPARSQGNHGREHGVQMPFHMIVGEERLVFLVPQTHLLGVLGHEQAHEVPRGFPPAFPIHQNFIDLTRVHIADGAFYKACFLVNQRRCDRLKREFTNIIPQMQQIFAVARNFRAGALGTCRPHNHGHATGQVEVRHDIPQAATVCYGCNLAGNPAATQRVGHQHTIAASQRDISGKSCTLIAAFFLDHLNQQHLAAADDFLNTVVAHEAGNPLLDQCFFAGIGFTADIIRGLAAAIGAGSVFVPFGGGFGFRVFGLVRLRQIRFGVGLIGPVVGIIQQGFFFGLQGEQLFTVGNRNLVVVRVDFAKGQKTMAVAAIFNKGGLKAGLYANNAGKVDVSFELLFCSRFNIIIFKSVSIHNDNARFFRVRRIDQHTL